MKVQVETVLIQDLSKEQVNFLRQHTESCASVKEEDRIPIYHKEGNQYFFIDGVYSAVGKAVKAFISDAPKNLFLTGASTPIKVKEGWCAVADERKGMFKAASQGWAMYAEGENLLATAHRELSEEITVFTIGAKRTEIVADGVTPKGHAKILGIAELRRFSVEGKISPIGWYQRNDVKTLELVSIWDLSNVDDVITVVYDDEWWAGGYCGSPVVVLGDTGRPLGYYAGQQGLVRLDDYRPESSFCMIFDRRPKPEDLFWDIPMDSRN